MDTLSGEDLRKLRNGVGLSRSALAALAGIHPDTVKYWERKACLNLQGFAVVAMMRALLTPNEMRGFFGEFPDQYARMRGGVLESTAISAEEAPTARRAFLGVR